MDSSQASLQVNERADECLRHLQDLARRAEKASRTHPTASTADLLTNVERNARDSLRSLQTWKRDFGRGKVADDQGFVNTTTGLLENLRHWIDTAYDALESRLFFRKLFLIGFITSKRKHFEKRLVRALKDIEYTIGKLNTQLKILLVEPGRVIADRQSKVLDVRRDINQPYYDFCRFFERLKPEDKGNLRSFALETLWEHFGQWRDPIPDLNGKVGNSEDPGDGLLYGPEHIKRANALLKDLHQAWTNMEDCASHAPPNKLPKMGMICLILMGMEQHQLLEDFLDGEVCDDDLHLSKDRLHQILRDEHLDYVATFMSEQYRAKPRLWPDGQHAKMEDEEPLPLVYGKPYKKGSYGFVTKVHDPATGNEYALKQQIIGSIQSQNARAQKHLKDETQRLKGLQHKHVVSLVKSFERAGSYGLLLAPAATSDLVGLLDRFHKNKFFAPEGCQDQTWLRPILLTAFGCLSQGLAYIHGKDIRHKDIKPGNILYEKAKNKDVGARFLWADFGLAHDFSNTGDSKTDSTGIYSKRYAAPEILMASVNPARSQRSASVMILNRIVENADASKVIETSESEEKLLSEFKEDEDTKHGRKTDIFSLGCIFLELLAVLIDESLPMDHGKWSSAHQSKADGPQIVPDGGRVATAPIAKDDDMFCKHTNELKLWAEPHSLATSDNDTKNHDPSSKAALAPLFSLAISMISWKADDRPLIDEVVRKVAATGKHCFCESCLAQLPPMEQQQQQQQKPFKSTAASSSAAASKERTSFKPKRTESLLATPESPATSSESGPSSLLRRSTAALFGPESHGPANPLMKIISR